MQKQSCACFISPPPLVLASVPYIYMIVFTGEILHEGQINNGNMN
jgi:hypothetical protein